jgi:hypothetical protein
MKPLPKKPENNLHLLNIDLNNKKTAFHAGFYVYLRTISG